MKISIRVKIILPILVAFSMLFSIYLYTIDGKLKERVTLLNTNLTNQIIDARANQISYWLEQRKIELEMISNFIIQFDMDETKAREYIQKMYKQKSDIYLDMGMVKFGGYKLKDHDVHWSISEEGYYKNALKENASFFVSDPMKKNGEYVVVMLHKVRGVNKDIEFIYAEIPLEDLMRIASKITVYKGHGEILIKNKSIHTDKNAPNQDFMKEEYIVFETDITAARGWSLNYYIPKNNIYQINYDMSKSVLLFAGILLIIIIILLTISFTSVVNPIEKLKRSMKRVESGDLSVRMESSRKDEIGSLVSSFNNMIEKLEIHSYQEKEMRLRIMQEQIKPHFLYNTLDTIKWAAMEDSPEEVLELIDSLSTYFRIGLSSGRKFITLDEEIEHIDSYLNIQKARYEDRLTYSIHYDECLMDCMVLRVLLQPIVENAVIHGVDKKEDGGRISIHIISRDEDVMIRIMNNSEIQTAVLEHINQSLRSDRKTQVLKGYGLYNVNHRIRLEYGERYGLEFRSKNGWTTVIITIPKVGGKKSYA